MAGEAALSIPDSHPREPGRTAVASVPRRSMVAAAIVVSATIVLAGAWAVAALRPYQAGTGLGYAQSAFVECGKS